MKNFYTLLIILCTFWSQAQNGITYQAVILNPNTEELPGADNSRLPLVNQDITLEFKILNASSSLDYQEIINTQTDEFGMVNVVIGTGTRKAGIATQFSTINWDGSAKNLIVSLDPSGQSTHFIEISNQPFTYVPFALYAAHTGVTGTQGPAGNNGLDGKTVLNGTTIPNASIGTNGDFYINTATSNLFGPKTNDVWGNGVPLVGPQGIQGIAGPTGSTGPQGTAGTNGSNGQDGLSAYQIWLNAGNTGTEAQFLTALRGATGAQGPQGIAGTNGSNGLSAYQIWLNAGNTGTEAQFLTSLQGATGPQGVQGLQGLQGIPGTNGINGVDGAIGPQGPIGLTGPAGATGPTGATGAQGLAGTNGTNGTNGVNGQDGLSAYQIWLNAGNTGTEAQFLTALRGATGTQGIQGIADTNGTNGLDGKTILNGNQDPINNTGNNGDFYINTTANLLFGPKTSGAWGSGIALVGPQGAAGVNGKNSLINTTTVSVGSNDCPNGGIKIEVGLDLNNNGILESNEIENSKTKYICQTTQNSGRVFAINSQGTYQVPSGKTWTITNIIVGSTPPTINWTGNFVRYISSGVDWSGYGNWIIADFGNILIQKYKAEVFQFGQNGVTSSSTRNLSDTFLQNELNISLPIVLNSGQSLTIVSGLILNITEN